MNSVRRGKMCSYFRGVGPLQQRKHDREELKMWLAGSRTKEKAIQMGKRQDETHKHPQWPVSSSVAPSTTFHGLTIIPSHHINALINWLYRAFEIKLLLKRLSASMESPHVWHYSCHLTFQQRYSYKINLAGMQLWVQCCVECGCRQILVVTGFAE